MKVAATMRLLIERVQGGVAVACRKTIFLTVVLPLEAVPEDMMLVDVSEVELTQSEHFFVAMM